MSGDGHGFGPGSMLELFRVEVENQVGALNGALLALEANPRKLSLIDTLMRAAHSIKGAARIINHPLAVTVAHALEDVFVAAQNQEISLAAGHVDLLLQGSDMLLRLSLLSEDALADAESSSLSVEVGALADALSALARGQDGPAPVAVREASSAEARAEPAADARGQKLLRVNAANLDELLGLAGEALVEARQLRPFTDALLRLRRRQSELGLVLDHLQEAMQTDPERASDALRQAQGLALECRKTLAEELVHLDQFDRRTSYLTQQIYNEASASRMRPFADGVGGMPRMVRDLARSLGKEVRLEILGLETLVDRDILEKIEAPLNHLLTNAVDHGIEFPDERLAAGKPAEGVVRLEARHAAGMLAITVADDGMGVPLERLRRAVIERGLASTDMVAVMSEAELLEFLYLPAFSMKDVVTDVSGRGVGLDVVLSAIQEVRGSLRTFSEAGRGTRFQLHLPQTLSVVQGLLAGIGGEPYAFPLARVHRALKLAPDQLFSLEGREYFLLQGERVGLVAAYQVLGLPNPGQMQGEEFSVVVINDRHHLYGLVVDRFLGERSLVVQALDPRLGKIKDVSAATLMEDGAPALILDVDDLARSIEKLVSGGSLDRMNQHQAREGAGARRVLVVDDSFTVREVEKKLLENRGYRVEVAVDGMDGWNAVRSGAFDLVISDIDMPRMNGIELVGLIRKNPALKNLPIMIVSYKDREEDRHRGLEAGANYYFTKGSFHDEALLDAVVDLIGEALP